MNATVVVPMVTLTPAGWLPNTNTTDGQLPTESIMISQTFWEMLGKPKSIEEYRQRLQSYAGINTFEFRGFPKMEM